MLKLFKYEGYQLTVEPEALLLKPFQKLWARDKSANKNKVFSELGFIYFYSDPRSDFQYLVDPDTRMQAIKKSEGFASTWKPDKYVLEAIAFYESFIPISAMLLEDARFATNNLRVYLRGINLNATDEKGKPIYPLASFVNALKQIPGLVESLNKAEKIVNSDLKENNKMRGQGEKTLMEDTLNI